MVTHLNTLEQTRPIEKYFGDNTNRDATSDMRATEKHDGGGADS